MKYSPDLTKAWAEGLNDISKPCPMPEPVKDKDGKEVFDDLFDKDMLSEYRTKVMNQTTAMARPVL